MADFQKEKIVNFWKDGARKSLRLANDIAKRKYYDHALFCGHLALEKLLKAMVVLKVDSHAPHSHDLLYLAGLAKIDLDVDTQTMLAEINEFNIEGRYPEEKLDFHRRINKAVADEWLQKINKIFLWLSKLKEKN